MQGIKRKGWGQRNAQVDAVGFGYEAWGAGEKKMSYATPWFHLNV